MFGQKPFGVQGGHAAGTGGGDGLAVDFVLDITGGKYAIDGRFAGAGLGFDITGIIQSQLPFQKGSVGDVANGVKQPPGF